jgi:Na+-transporting methylmalonyl-CoA/oxaloacetate decarboxylase gamma subunit
MAIFLFSGGFFGGNGVVVLFLILMAFAAGTLFNSLFGKKVEEEVEAAYAEAQSDVKKLATDVGADVAKAKQEVLAQIDALHNRYLGAIHPLRQEFGKLRAKLLQDLDMHKPFDIPPDTSGPTLLRRPHPPR